jgi:hypothetical protein
MDGSNLIETPLLIKPGRGWEWASYLWKDILPLSGNSSFFFFYRVIDNPYHETMFYDNYGRKIKCML